MEFCVVRASDPTAEPEVVNINTVEDLMELSMKYGREKLMIRFFEYTKPWRKLLCHYEIIVCDD